MHDGPNDEGRVDAGEARRLLAVIQGMGTDIDWKRSHLQHLREIRLLLLDELPRSPLGEGLTGAVSIRRVQSRLFESDWVPIFLRIHMSDVQAFGGIYNGSKGRRDNYVLHSGGVLLNRLEDARRANNGRVQEIFLDICNVEMELQDTKPI